MRFCSKIEFGNIASGCGWANWAVLVTFSLIILHIFVFLRVVFNMENASHHRKLSNLIHWNLSVIFFPNRLIAQKLFIKRCQIFLLTKCYCQIMGMFLWLSKTKSMTFGRSKKVSNIFIQCPISFVFDSTKFPQHSRNQTDRWSCQKRWNIVWGYLMRF